MRRSFAPSRGGCLTKRGRFCPPFSYSKVVDGTGEPVQVMPQECVSSTADVDEPRSTARSTVDLLKLIEDSDSASKENEDQYDHGERSTDCEPEQVNLIHNLLETDDDDTAMRQFGKQVVISDAGTGSPAPVTVTPDGDDDAHYFNTVWCKLSARKHKKWEGDAILIVKRHSVILKDLNSKEIGKALGYKKVQLESLEEGSRLKIGGKEVEIMSSISAEIYSSGRCFTANASDQSACENLTNKRCSEPFKVPTRSEGIAMKPERPSRCPLTVVAPKFDPSQPGAFVLPRPSPSHQWKFNSDHLPIVDVVVDPVVGKRLRPHQRDGVTFLYECVMQMRGHDGHGAILADDMGLGKTLQCITLIWTLLKQGPYGGRPIIKRALVVTPSSLTKNWQVEFNMWLGKERLSVCVADQSNKIVEYAKTPKMPVLITSYELLMRHHELLFVGTAFDLVVCDEGHRLKNANTKTSSMLASLPVKRRVVLTGTPIQNDLQEFYALVEYCNPGILGSALTFRRVYEEPILRSKQKNASRDDVAMGAARAAELSRITGLFTLRRTQDVINKYLPPKLEYVVFCRPTPLQITLYKRILESRCLRSCLSEAGGHHIRDGSFHLVCIDALKKVCNHPTLILAATRDVAQLPSGMQDSSPYNDLISAFDLCDDPSDADNSGKLRVLSSLLGSLSRADSTPRERVVLVSSSTRALNVLEQFCKERDYTTARLDGSTPAAARQSLVDNFNSPYSNNFVFLLSTRAGGVGLNLVGASRIVLYDIDWNPANDLQAMSRVWRDGQLRPVHIYRLLTRGTIEEKIYQRQVMKQNLSGAVVDGRDSKKMHFSREQLKDIFSLDEESSCNTHDLLGCECLMDQDDDDFTRNPRAIETPVGRSCQLDLQTSWNKSKNFSMDELMSWQHFDGHPLKLDEIQDSFLSDCDDVTFTFRNVTATSSDSSSSSSTVSNSNTFVTFFM